jgi:hypothetical protein
MPCLIQDKDVAFVPSPYFRVAARSVVVLVRPDQAIHLRGAFNMVQRLTSATRDSPRTATRTRIVTTENAFVVEYGI